MNYFKPALYVLLFFAVLASSLPAQQDLVVPILKDIEAGKLDEARTRFDEIKFKHKDEPGIIFIEGLLSENADEAVKHYSKVYKNHPKSAYADAAVFRMYSYYFATDNKTNADKYLAILKKEYPKSPYLAGISGNTSTPLTESKQEATSAQETAKPPVKETFITLQAGAFTVLRNALLLKDKLVQAGWQVEIREKVVGGSNFFIVYAGVYNSDADAKTARDKLNREMSLEGRIVSLER